MAKNSASSGPAFRPLHDKILVKRDTPEDKTAAGIILPEKAKDTRTLNTETGHLVPLTVKKGERVLFSSYAGTEIKLDGKEFLVMSEQEVLAVIED